jgi:hypothetical protein
MLARWQVMVQQQREQQTQADSSCDRKQSLFTLAAQLLFSKRCIRSSCVTGRWQLYLQQQQQQQRHRDGPAAGAAAAVWSCRLNHSTLGATSMDHHQHVTS